MSGASSWIKWLIGEQENEMKYFGTDGFRGVAGTELTVEHAYKIGRFIG